jgi:hypothetical protein
MREIRCYGKPRVANGLVFVVAAGILLMAIAGLLEGHDFEAFITALIGYSAVFLVWLASRYGTFIAVDPDTERLSAANFFIRTRQIPVGSITDISTRGMFAGAATELEITYRQSSGRKTTVGYGTINFLNRKDLKRVLDALLEMNPRLRLPGALAEKLSSRTP